MRLLKDIQQMEWKSLINDIKQTDMISLLKDRNNINREGMVIRGYAINELYQQIGMQDST